MAFFLPPIVADNQVTRPEPPSFSLKSQTPKNKRPKVGRSHSLGDWWKKNMRPSERPEQGGTIRENVFLDDIDPDGRSAKQPLRRAADTHRARRSETADSDKLTRWNTPKNVSEDNGLTSQPPRRAFSGGVKVMPPSSSDRKWSWAPQDDMSQQRNTQHAEKNDLKVSWQDLELDDDLEDDQGQSKSAADRRLSNFRRDVEAKKERRRQRRSLKESGDFLGVQGINPETGQLDVITPSGSDNSIADPEVEKKIRVLRQALKNARDTYKDTAEKSEREVKRLILKKEKETLDKRQMEKVALASQFQGPRWRRHTKQWSSAQEPELSPIPQSLRIGTPISRRPSHPAIEPEEAPPLINLTSPPKSVLPTDKAEDLLTPEASGLTSRSSATVVRTPHRQSLAVGKSAAQELFDNGISFNLPDPPDPNGTAFEESDTGPRTPNERSRSVPSTSGVPLSEQQRQSGVPADILHKTANSDPKSSRTGPFLDIPTLGEASSQGYGSKPLPRPLSMGNLLKRDKHPTPSRSFSLLPKRLPSQKTTHRTSMSEATAEPDPSLTPANFAPRTSPKETAQLFEERDQSLEGSPLHRISPKQFLLNLKEKRRMKKDHHQHRIEQVVSGQELKSVTNLPQTQGGAITPTKDGIQQDQEIHSAPHLLGRGESPAASDIQRDMEFLRRKVERIDEYHLTREQEESNRLSTDHDWIEGTIRGITEKGDEIMKAPISTLTTTTTGFGRQTSGSSLNQESIGARKKRSWDQSRNHQHCEKPTWDEKGIRSKNFQEKRPQSSLLRLTPEWQIVPNDITSTDSQEPWDHEEQVRDHCQHSTSSTSTSVLEDPKDLRRKISAMYKDHQKKPHHANVAHRAMISTAIGKTDCPIQGAEREHQNQIKLHEKTQKALEVQMRDFGSMHHASTLTTTCPGAFPQQPDAEEGIADRSERTPSEMIQRGEWNLTPTNIRGIWCTLKEIVFVARCHLAVFMRLYWGLTRPVFDRSSDYWVRNARGDATLMDGMTFVLALPGAVLGLLAFM